MAVCGFCGALLPPRTYKRGRTRKFCSKQCGASFRRQMGQEQEYNRRYYARNIEQQRERCREKARRFRAEQPELACEQLLRWRQANPQSHRETQRKRYAQKRGAAVVEDVDLDALFERDGQRCHICKKVVKRPDASMDHLVPLSKGGDHSWANVALAHRSCNSKRGAGRLSAQLRLVG